MLYVYEPWYVRCSLATVPQFAYAGPIEAHAFYSDARDRMGSRS